VLGFLVPGLASIFGAPVWDFPPTTASGDEVAAYVGEHRDALLVGVLGDVIGVTLWGMFGAGLWVRIRRAAGGESLLSAFLLFGVIAFVTLLLAGFTLFLVLAYRGGDVADPRLVYDFTFALLAMSGVPTAVALGAYAALTLRHQHLPRWTAVLAAICAGAHVVLLASFLVDEGFFSLEGQVITAIPATLFFWVLATGVALLLEPGNEKGPPERAL
jgi:hypothetical protein